jgi:hypothetical protein
MLECEGYKMLKGIGYVKPKSAKIIPFQVYGTWLYKPDTKCWYCDGHSFSEEIVTSFKEDIPQQVEQKLLGVDI